MYIGVIGSYGAVHVYQADAFIYTHLIFRFSSIYRLVAMVTTFPLQVQEIYSMLEATLHRLASVFTFILFLFFLTLTYFCDYFYRMTRGKAMSN